MLLIFRPLRSPSASASSYQLSVLFYSTFAHPISNELYYTLVAQFVGRSHAMRNELHFSSEVAPDGSSWHLWLRHEMELLPHRQKASATRGRVLAANRDSWPS